MLKRERWLTSRELQLVLLLRPRQFGDGPHATIVRMTSLDCSRMDPTAERMSRCEDDWIVTETVRRDTSSLHQPTFLTVPGTARSVFNTVSSTPAEVVSGIGKRMTHSDMEGSVEEEASAVTEELISSLDLLLVFHDIYIDR